MPYSSLPKILATAVLLTVFILPCHAILRRDDVSEQLYIDLANQVQFAPVGGLRLNNYGGNGTIGSGTLIAPNWVLTAGHCVYGNLNALSFTINDVSYAADADYAIGSYIGAANGYADDIGLVHLSSAVTSVTSAYYYGGKKEQGQIGYSVGYGRRGNGLTGEQTNAVTDAYGGMGAGTAARNKRAAKNIIDYAGSGVIESDFDKPGGKGDAAPLDLEGCIGAGDSGGGVFAFIDNVWQVVGVHSVIYSNSTPTGKYNDFYDSTRVSDYQSFIFATTGIAAYSAGGVMPEPRSLALVFLGGAVLSVYRRRGGRAKRVSCSH